VKEFAPGVRINWPERTVELEAAVVLRDGPLELLACSPHTREHESILSIRARPLHVFQAMGLIGLRPGSPLRYDEKRDRWLPPTGEVLRLRVRYTDKEAERTVPAERWLVDLEHRRPVKELKWVFAGSRTFESGRFGADLDGTVVCVVDFDTALITVGALHSSDNALLWLAANTEVIPPVGTPCKLLIGGAAPTTIRIEVDAKGVIRHKGAAVSVAELSRIVDGKAEDSPPKLIEITPTGAASDETIASTIENLVGAGVDRGSIKVRGQSRETVDGPAGRVPGGC
jgi:hypothetical protein